MIELYPANGYRKSRGVIKVDGMEHSVKTKFENGIIYMELGDAMDLII